MAPELSLHLAAKEGNVTPEIVSCLQLPSIEWPGYKADMVASSRQAENPLRRAIPQPHI